MSLSKPIYGKDGKFSCPIICDKNGNILCNLENKDRDVSIAKRGEKTVDGFVDVLYFRKDGKRYEIRLTKENILSQEGRKITIKEYKEIKK